MKEWVQRLLAVAMGLVISWMLLEGALRLVGGDPAAQPRSVAIHEPHRSQIDRPHRRKPPNPPRGAPRFKLLAVGDSFTWGAGIYDADTWGRRLESLLERMDRGLDVRLTLFSRPGWNTAQEYEAVRRMIDGLRPDLIVVGYCLNDTELRLREGNDDIMGPTRRRVPRGAVASWLYRRSRLSRLVWERLENSRQRRAFDRYYHQLYQRVGWEETQEAFDGFRRLAWDHEIPVVVAVFPIFDQQLDAGYSYRDLHRRVMEALRRRDLLAVDLLPAYRGIDAVRLAVDPFFDPHPNELAHRIASQYLADYLVRRELVPITLEQRAGLELSLPGKGATTRR